MTSAILPNLFLARQRAVTDSGAAPFVRRNGAPKSTEELRLAKIGDCFKKVPLEAGPAAGCVRHRSMRIGIQARLSLRAVLLPLSRWCHQPEEESGGGHAARRRGRDAGSYGCTGCTHTFGACCVQVLPCGSCSAGGVEAASGGQVVLPNIGRLG